ncbi:LOW QUALITY PROTEIN: carboxypeptidase O [Cavia porcellus]|uniref:LOW QUALITY PROTEIN: carboxypeptidase O n=1 Tax=Cavia porcellus TaxID=10141 RepID=UPI000661AF2D
MLLITAVNVTGSSILSTQGEQVMDRAVNLDTYSYTEYHPMAEIYEWIVQLREMSADTVIQHLLGVTHKSPPMYYLKISQLSSTPKKIIWMDCGIHARDWIAPAFCQWFVKEILQNYEGSSRISRFLETLDLYVLPVLNIDRCMYTWTPMSSLTLDQLWRKSRSSHNNGSCCGSDLNRNFNISWCSSGASTNCQDIIFCDRATGDGTGPEAEPETKAVANLIESRKEDMLCSLAIHCHGQLILVLYGCTTNKPSNQEEMIQVGEKEANTLRAKHGTNYRVESSADILYKTFGSSRDWTGHIEIPFSYTSELRDNGTHEFILPEEQMRPTCEVAMEAVLSILDVAHAKYWLSRAAGKLTCTSAVLTCCHLPVSALDAASPGLCDLGDADVVAGKVWAVVGKTKSWS